eukprot:1159142-Pelagomonas_calceolata.AAC.6
MLSSCKHGLENASHSVRAQGRTTLGPGLSLPSQHRPVQHQCRSRGAAARLANRLTKVQTAQKEETESSTPVAQVPTTQQQQQAHQLLQQQELQGVGSKSIHEGERSGRQEYHDTLTTPIAQTSTYFFNNTQQVIDFNEGRRNSNEYGRYGNPTVKAVQEKLMALEGAEDCIVAASGMNSVTSMLLSLVPAGGHIVTTSDCYWRTRQFMQQFLPKMNIGVSVIAPDDLQALEEALERNPVTLYFSESPTNPYLRCIDIKRVCELCHAKVGLEVVCVCVCVCSHEGSLKNPVLHPTHIMQRKGKECVQVRTCTFAYSCMRAYRHALMHALTSACMCACVPA